ncbi:MAG: cell division protein ZapA [Betaproteobacteria bacterium]
MPDTVSIAVNLLGREYRLACKPEERDQLQSCARFVDQKMTAIRDSGKVMGHDNIAALAALQIAQEFMSARNADGLSIGELRRRLRDLNQVADEMLAPQEKLF